MHRLAEAPGRVDPAKLTPLVARRGDVHTDPVAIARARIPGGTLPGLHRRSIKGKAT